uniref:Transcription factor Spi-C n=1 Tax=Cyprinus carpio carpio TaxID=630221 RepID=A0A8C1EN69_CYPCA
KKVSSAFVVYFDAISKVRNNLEELQHGSGFCPPLHAQTHTHKHCLTTVVCMIAGKKLRLFHFLFEMLEDPGMAHCVSWVSASVGVFRFSARHKERVAELWGQRKGNRMPMTYQKMSRALRNYAHSGEIIKVKKKLTYQFSVWHLQRNCAFLRNSFTFLIHFCN